MIDSILVICVGNVCRSPVGATLLKAELPNVTVKSAGLKAVVGSSADDTMQELVARRGLNLKTHRACQFNVDDMRKYDLLLVMENDMRRSILRANPTLCGKVKLFGQWLNDEREIIDPHNKSRDLYEIVYQRLENAAQSWKHVFTH